MSETEASDPRRLMLTPAEVRRYQDQLDELRTVRGRDIPALLRDARTFVASDAVEEIAQIQGDLTVVDARIAVLEEILEEAQVVDDDGLDPEVAAFGRLVTVEYVGTGALATFRLGGTGASESAETRVVSARSPVGRALLGRSCGEVVTAELPTGHEEPMRILSVTGRPEPQRA